MQRVHSQCACWLVAGVEVTEHVLHLVGWDTITHVCKTEQNHVRWHAAIACNCCWVKAHNGAQQLQSAATVPCFPLYTSCCCFTASNCSPEHQHETTVNHEPLHPPVMLMQIPPTPAPAAPDCPSCALPLVLLLPWLLLPAISCRSTTTGGASSTSHAPYLLMTACTKTEKTAKQNAMGVNAYLQGSLCLQAVYHTHVAAKQHEAR